MVKPFLSHNKNSNSSSSSSEPPMHAGTPSNPKGYDVRTIYPILAGVSGLFAMAFLFIGFYTRSTPGHKHQELTLKPTMKNQDHVNNTQTCEKTPFRKVEKVMFVCLVTSYLFLFTGLEVMYGTYIAAFAVESRLRLDKQEGANIAAIFYGSFAFSRAVGIFASMKFKTLHLLVTGLTICMLSGAVLVVYGQQTVLALQICTALMGFGISPAFPCTLLWMEEIVTVSSKIGSSLMIAASVGADVFPIVLGQFIEDEPMMQMYLSMAIIVSCLIILATALFTTARARNRVSIK